MDTLHRTPRHISPQIEAIVRAAVGEGTPSRVRNAPSSSAQINECFSAVAQQVNDHGGRIQHGWALWEWPGVLVEAEFHAVWVAPDGELVDVSRRPKSLPEILFFPDPFRAFTGTSVDNIRVPLRDDPRISEFIAAAEQRFVILNSGDLAQQFGMVEAPSELRPVLRRMAELEIALRQWTPGRNAPCSCGSGKKYKKCCA